HLGNQFHHGYPVGVSGRAHRQRSGSADYTVRAFRQWLDRPSGAMAGGTVPQSALPWPWRDSVGPAVVRICFALVEGAGTPALRSGSQRGGGRSEMERGKRLL